MDLEQVFEHFLRSQIKHYKITSISFAYYDVLELQVQKVWDEIIAIVQPNVIQTINMFKHFSVTKTILKIQR